MSIKKVDRKEWSSYFNDYSKSLMSGPRVDYAEIRLLSNEFGAVTETDWLPLKGITYDRKNNLLDIAVEHMDHLVYQPTEIYVDELDEGILGCLEIIRKDGTKDIIDIR